MEVPMHQVSYKNLRVFIPFAMGYFLSYVYRVVNAVIAPDLVSDLNMDPSQLGLLTSTYFISFASSQLALGVLLDRYGPRIINSCLLLFAGTGALIFAVSGTLAGVIVGRILIGFGVSACLMASFKAYVLWFPEKMWPRVNGFQMAAGGLGALTAATPVEWLLQMTDWRGLFMGLALLSLLIALIVFFVVPEKRSEKHSKKVPESFQSQLSGVKQVFCSREFWRVAPAATLSQAAFLSIQGLWVGPWLRDVGGMGRIEIAATLSWIALAMITGFISLGFIAEKLSRKGVDLLLISVVGMAVFMGIQGGIILGMFPGGTLAWVLFGFFGTSGIITYAGLSQHFPSHLSGRVTTGINLLVFVAAFASQWAIGAIINLWETGAGIQGHYAVEGYSAGFGTMLVIQLIGLAWFFVAGAGAGKRDRL